MAPRTNSTLILQGALVAGLPISLLVARTHCPAQIADACWIDPRPRLPGRLRGLDSQGDSSSHKKPAGTPGRTVSRNGSCLDPRISLEPMQGLHSILKMRYLSSESDDTNLKLLFPAPSIAS
jgi:hypothetical protein